MKKTELNDKMKEELNHISTGERRSFQRSLRYAYNVKRRERMDIPKEVVLKACIDSVKKQEPSFKAEYDKEYFKMSD